MPCFGPGWVFFSSMGEFKMKIKISEVVFREDLYPRKQVNQSKVQVYSESIDVLPPIVLNQDNILMDGRHRQLAHKQKGCEEIEATIIQTKDEDDLFLQAIELNSKHGFQLEESDKKKIACEMVSGSSERDKQIIKSLSIPERTYYSWVGDKLKTLKEVRNEEILTKWLTLKYTQEELAKEYNVHRETIIKLIKNVCRIIARLQKNDISEEEQKELLNEIEDKKLSFLHNKLKDFQPFLYNIWNVNKNNNSTTHFGNIPVEFVENLLYYYTEPFDVVYDPFAGGGITIDASNKWFRRYYVSDRKPIPAREETIKNWDVADGLPSDLPKPKLIFLDPPYWTQAKSEYSEDGEDLANMELVEFEDKMKQLFKALSNKCNSGTYMAFIISASQWKVENHQRVDHALDFIKMAEMFNWKLHERIICPYSTEQYNGTQVNIAKDEKIMMNLYRDLVVMKLK